MDHELNGGENLGPPLQIFDDGTFFVFYSTTVTNFVLIAHEPQCTGVGVGEE